MFFQELPFLLVSTFVSHFERQSAESRKGMAKAVADVDNPDEKEGGFASDDSDITGFSHSKAFAPVPSNSTLTG